MFIFYIIVINRLNNICKFFTLKRFGSGVVARPKAHGAGKLVRFDNHARPKTHGSSKLARRLVGANPSFLGLASLPYLL